MDRLIIGSQVFEADYVDRPTKGNAGSWLPIKISLSKSNVCEFTRAIKDYGSTDLETEQGNWILTESTVLNGTAEGITLGYKHAIRKEDDNMT